MPDQIPPDIKPTDEIALLGRQLLVDGALTGGLPKREADRDHDDYFRGSVGDARLAARADPYGVNAVRTHRDSVIGASIRLALSPDYEALGVTQDEAQDWVRRYQREFSIWANGYLFECDAARQQTLTGIFRTIHDSHYVAGEAVAVMKFKPGFGRYETCIHVLEPERISTPPLEMANKNVRHGIERDLEGAPVAYWISQPQSIGFNDFMQPLYDKWIRVPRYTSWGRPLVLHSFQHLRPDMTRGISTFAAVIRQMKMLRHYSITELQSAITQAAYAAVVKTDLPWEKALEVVGAKASPQTLAKYGNNPISASMFEYMSMIANFYGEMGLRYQGGRIPHLMPNEELQLLKSDHPNNGFTAFESAMLRTFSAGLGIDYPALSKNYSEVSYSAARAALADVWRSYMVDRMHLSDTIGMPIVACHMEEALIKGYIPMLGKMDWLEARHYLVRGMFVGWGKPLIDPEKERKAQLLGLNMNVTTRTKITAEEGEDFEDVTDQRSYEEKRMEAKQLTPEVLQPELAFSASGSDGSDGGNK